MNNQKTSQELETEVDFMATKRSFLIGNLALSLVSTVQTEMVRVLTGNVREGSKIWMHSG